MNHLSRFIKTTNFGFPNIPEQVQSIGSNKRGGPGVQTPAGGKQTPPAAFPDNWNMYPAWQLIFRWD